MVNQTTASPCVGCSRMLPSAPGPSFRFTAVKFESIAPDFVGATVGHSGTSDRRDDPPADLRCWSNRNPSELGPFPPKIHENPWNIMNHHETLGILSWKVWNVEVFLQFKPKPELGASSSCRYTQYLTLSPADTRYVLQKKISNWCWEFQILDHVCSWSCKSPAHFCFGNSWFRKLPVEQCSNPRLSLQILVCE